MLRSLRSRLAFVPSMPFVLLAAFLMILFWAGGSSRPDVLGQAVIRAAAALFIIVSILLGPRPIFMDVKPVWIILIGAILLPSFQLIPLPPEAWRALPGRELFTNAATAIGEPQPWRPISLVPGATFGALGSLIAPLATLLLVCQIKERERRLLPGMILFVISASVVISLMQFSGLSVRSPVGDNVPGDVSAFFANRNHFALLLAIGCILAPVWAFSKTAQQWWRLPLALALTMLFTLLILASGSRAGMALGILALCFGAILTARDMRRALARYPRWGFPAAITAIIAVILILTLVSVAANRAASFERILTIDSAQEMRSRALPLMWQMVKTYFPAGTGFGTFDTIFRVHEPIEFLNPTYFNHAHNDLLEVILDGGLAGLVLLVGAQIWWIVATFRAWRTNNGKHFALPLLGSGLIFLIIAASIVDYPARTALILGVLVIAAFWLAAPTHSRALPPSSRHL